tara:strand:+ start:6419 stop:6787 length:369 start_codon:yes stop_codon:yes gene_type:complete
MDTEKIIERLELGEPLTKICKDKDMPSLSAFYKTMRHDEELQKKVRQARETGCFTIIDKMNEELEIPQDNQHMMWMRERLSQGRWLASKLSSGVFGDKSKQEIKQDTTLTVSWGNPNLIENN